MPGLGAPGWRDAGLGPPSASVGATPLPHLGSRAGDVGTVSAGLVESVTSNTPTPLSAVLRVASTWCEVHWQDDVFPVRLGLLSARSGRLTWPVCHPCLALQRFSSRSVNDGRTKGPGYGIYAFRYAGIYLVLCYATR